MHKQALILVTAWLAAPVGAAPHVGSTLAAQANGPTASRIAARHYAASPFSAQVDLCLRVDSAGCARALSAALTSSGRPRSAATPGLEVHRADLEKILGVHVVPVSNTATYAAAQQAGPLPFRDQEPLVRRVEKISKEGLQFIRRPRGQQGELTVGISRKGLIGFSLKTSSD